MEKIVEVVQAQIKEVIVKEPQVHTQEVTKHVPIQTAELLMEVPQLQTKEVRETAKEVPQITVQEVVKEVPKVTTIDVQAKKPAATCNATPGFMRLIFLAALLGTPLGVVLGRPPGIQDCGFEHPVEVQHECIPQAILGTDILCQAISGRGKTAISELEGLQQIDAIDNEEKAVKVLVVCHTRELAYQIKCDKCLDKLGMRKDDQQIFIEMPEKKQVIMLSVTMTSETRALRKKFMQDPHEIRVDEESKLTLHGLPQYFVKLSDKEKNRKLNDLLDALEFNQVAICVKSVQVPIALDKFLVECDFPSIAFHPGPNQDERIARYKLGMRKDDQQTFIETPEKKQVMMLSATMTSETRVLCKKTYARSPRDPGWRRVEAYHAASNCAV